jgi:hypothetical protein
MVDWEHGSEDLSLQHFKLPFGPFSALGANLKQLT